MLWYPFIVACKSMRDRSRVKYLGLMSLVVLVVLAACSASTPSPAGTELVTGTVLPTTQTATSTATVTPTATEAPRIALLYAPQGANPQFVSDMESALSDLASADGIELRTVSQLSSSEISEEVQIVVVLPPDPGVRALASASPQTPFVAVGIPGVEAAGNLSVLGAQGERPDRQGFLAGYLAATITPQWRVGVISSQDTPEGLAAGRAFQNGVIFFCGLCRQSRPPYYEYPQVHYLPGGAGQAQFQAAVDQMVGSAVDTVYVGPGLSDPMLLEGLAAAGIHIIGSTPAAQPTAMSWVATIGADWITPLTEIWQGLVGGEGNVSRDVQLVIQDRNPDLFSPGRQRLVDETLLELQAGYIGTGVDPLSGEYVQFP